MEFEDAKDEYMRAGEAVMRFGQHRLDAKHAAAAMHALMTAVPLDPTSHDASDSVLRMAHQLRSTERQATLLSAYFHHFQPITAVPCGERVRA